VDSSRTKTTNKQEKDQRLGLAQKESLAEYRHKKSETCER
jgi:hypothetical protein